MKPAKIISGTAKTALKASVFEPTRTLHADTTGSTARSPFAQFLGVVAALFVPTGASYLALTVTHWWPLAIIFTIAACLGLLALARRIAPAADTHRAIRVREVVAEIRSLLADRATPRGEFEKGDDPELPASWRAQLTRAGLTVGVGAIVVAFAAALAPALLPQVDAALPATVHQFLAWHPALALGGYLALAGVVAGSARRHSRGRSGAASEQIVWLAHVLTICKVTKSQWDTYGGSYRIVFPDARVEVTMPAIAHGLPEAYADQVVAARLPGWLVEDFNGKSFTLVRAHSDDPRLQRREQLESTGGIVTAERDGEKTPLRPGHLVWDIAPGARVDPRQVAALARSRGLTLVEWREHDSRAHVARIDQRTLTLRERLADRIGCPAWDIELSVDDHSNVSRVVIVRSPVMRREPEKRRRFWLGQAADLLSAPSGYVWRYEESLSHGACALLLFRDVLAVPLSYTEDPTIPTAPDTPWRVGIDEEGQPIEVNLASSAHMMIAGATRSGKSVATYGLLTHVARMGDYARLLVADPNDATLAPFEDLVSWSTNSVDPTPVINMLKWVRAEMESRREVLRALRSDKITEFTSDLPMIVIVVDEAANYLRTSDLGLRRELESELLAVVSQGAKFGVRVVLITQRPDSTILPTAIRSQLSVRISFGLEDLETAKMIFPDIPEPSVLLGLLAGVGYVKIVGVPLRRFRAFYLADHWEVASRIPRAMPTVDVDVPIRKAQPVEDRGPEIVELPPTEFSLDELASFSFDSE